MERKRISAIIFHSNWIFLSLVFVLNFIALILDKNIYWGINLTSMILMLILFFINFFLFRFLHWLLNFFGRKEKCSYSSKEACPYNGADDCPYDVSACFVYQGIKPVRKRVYIISCLFFLSIVISLGPELLKENSTMAKIAFKDFGLFTIVKMLQPIAQSVIAAIIISLIIDIPERIKEYKGFFVDILTSYDYLKTMDEETLTDLRKRVTRQLHIKDFPNMAEGLIDLDERFCKMLKQPYFSEYSQIVSVQGKKPIFENEQENEQKDKKVIDFDEFIFKSHKTEYVAINPMHTNTPIKMDIGQNNCVKFQSTEYITEAQQIFKIKKFTIIFDDDKRAYDLMPYVSVAVSTEKMDGLIYNGIVSIRPKNAVNNCANPFSLEFFKAKEKVANKKETKDGKKEEKQSSTVKDKTSLGVLTEYIPVDKVSHVGLWASFHKKIQVKLEFFIAVPKIDVCYTKRLRYPVKLFNLDYSLNTDIEGYTVVGQMMGTLIDQPDVSTDLSLDEKRITMRTHNWLLPKNGAVVVHRKNDERSALKALQS